MENNKILSMHHFSILAASLYNAVSFFSELGLKLEGCATVAGEWVGRVTGLGNQNLEIAMMVTPDGHSHLELSQFINPSVISDHRTEPINSLGYLRIMFQVENLDETLERLSKHGAELVGEVVQYEDIYRLCYIRGVEGILIGLSEQLNK